MRRALLRSSAFVRAARRILRRNPGAAQELQAALELLADEAFHPQLRTHKLKGRLEGFGTQSFLIEGKE
jgi:mRNA-degrading endonuclease YafQ of YafQ-DinJ toxin-antitoxin module